MAMSVSSVTASDSPVQDSGVYQSSPCARATSDGFDTVDGYSHIPESSSTVIPSPPAIETTQATAASISSACQPDGVDIQEALGQQGVASNNNHGISTSQSSACTSASCQDPKCLANIYAHPLDTHEAQASFSRRLDELLLQIIHERNGLYASQNSDSPATSGTRTSMGNISTSSSVYAADISYSVSPDGFPVRSLSATSRSLSAASLAVYDRTRAVSHQESSGMASANSLSWAANTPMAIRFIYGSVSDDENKENEDIDDDVSSTDTPPDRTSTTDSAPLGTPYLRNDLTTPAAPRKAKSHFFAANPQAGDHTSRSPRKRPHHLANSDNPGPDDLMPGECMRMEPYLDRSVCHPSAYTQQSLDFPSGPGETDDNGHHKKRRTSCEGQQVTATTSRRALLASVPASLRRAASLRSDPSATIHPSGLVIKAEPTADVLPRSDSSQRNADRELDPGAYAPTQPATPISRPNKAKGSEGSLSLFPILSPSMLGLAPPAPTSVNDAAETRIFSLIKREIIGRRSDGLSVPDLSSTVDPEESDQEMWIALGEDVSNSSVRPGGQNRDTDTRRADTSPELQGPLALGIEEDFRVKVVEWILDATPETKKAKVSHLHAQLSQSPNTRWHAAHLLTRYFLRIGTSPLSSPIPHRSPVTGGDPHVLEGREALTWDVAVACVALSVKFHRDFLHPLYPVTAKDLISFAPHTMEYEDLEASQRDVLSGMAYCIGSSTPGAYIEELLIALPSIRAFAQAHGDWEFAQAETWEILFDSLIDVSYLRHPVHVITGCALVLGIVESIVYRKKTDSALKARFAPDAALKRRRGIKCDCDRLKAKAMKSVRDVERDIREVFAISERSWTKCLDWLKNMEG